MEDISDDWGRDPRFAGGHWPGGYLLASAICAIGALFAIAAMFS